MQPSTQRKIRAVFAWYFRALHGVELRGLEHLPAAGEPAVLIVNHQSFADGCFVATFLPGSPMFAVSRAIARHWWARPFLAVVRTFEVDPSHASAVKAMVAAVRQGHTLVMFPEGRITTTGSLMKIYDGAAVVAERAGAKLVPIRIDGLDRGPFARVAGRGRAHWFPRLRMTVLPAVAVGVDVSLRGRARRHAVAGIGRDLMRQAEGGAAETDRSIAAALLGAIARFGGGTEVLEDDRRLPLRYRDLLRGVDAMARRLAPAVAAGDLVGLRLANTCELAVAFLALQALGAIPLMLARATEPRASLGACAAAGARVILTSGAAMGGGAEGLALLAAQADVRVIWLEAARDVGARGTFFRPGGAGAGARWAGAATDCDRTAVVLTETAPEGGVMVVRRSHRAILSAVARATRMLGFTSADRVATTIAVTDEFALVLGLLLPLLSGARLLLIDPPGRHRTALDLIYDSDATVVVTDDATVERWGAYAGPHELYRTRAVLTRGDGKWG